MSTDDDTATMTCPSCHSDMHSEQRLGVRIAQCGSCRGLFLPASSLGALVEAENDWHVPSGPRTQPLPRITPDMTAPPPGLPAGDATRSARSFLDALFS